MDKLAIFRGVTTPVSDLAKAIQGQGWQLGTVKYDNKLNAFTAEAISPHGETLTKTGPDEGTAVANALLACTRRNHMRTTAQFKVGMWRTNWHERQREIAEAYRDAPIYDPKAVAAYKSLGDDSTHRLHVLAGQLHIEHTNDPQPYKSADDMRKDIHEKRHYYLTKGGAAHPVWTGDQVSAFRAVHDILGHGVAGGHYDWPGRVLAANAHAPLLDPTAQQALFSEAVARPAFLQTYGNGPQKVALFPEFVEHHQDSNNPSAHTGIHPSQTTAPVARADGFAAPLAKVASWGNTIDVNKGFESGVDPLPTNGFAHHGDPLQAKATLDNARLIDTGWAKFQKGDGSDDRERMKVAIVNAFRAVLLSPRKVLRWNAIHYQDISHIPGGVDDPKVYWETLEKARRKWNVNLGYAPDSHMIYFKFLKPFKARIAANHPEKGWEWAEAEAKQILNNWWTEEQERIQAEDEERPPDKQRGADEIERRANEALAKRMQLFLKAKDDKTDVEDGQISMFGSIHDTIKLAEHDYDGMIQHHNESWDKYNDLEGHKAPLTGWVPTEEVAKFAEYDRKPGGKDHMHFPGYWEALRSHIQQNGFKSPLYLDVNQDKGTSHLSEGNHRIQIAQELGIPHVPVIMYRSRRSSEAERPVNIDVTQFPEDRYDPTGYRMPDMFHPAIAGLPTREPYPGQHHVAADDNQQNILAEAPGKYGAFMGTHLKAISQVSQHVDEILDAALVDVREHDAEGHHFRHAVLQLGVSGVGPKVCSFAWLMLQPLTSQLATIDIHMMDVLGHDYAKEMNNRDYFKFERQFRAGLDAAGYSHLPLGAGQWGMWDYKRTGPGSHQDHRAMRVLDPTPHNEVDWVDKAVNLKGESWHRQAPDWWQNTLPARDAAGTDFDNTYGKSFTQGAIPYQDLGTSVTAKKNPDEFHVSWGVPDNVLDKLHSWAEEQGLGKVENRDDLHMTALYLPEGHSDQKYHDWIANQGSPSAEFSHPSIDFFPSQEEKGGTAIVVTFAGDEGKATSERLIDEAEEKGAEVKRFPGGYSPHITVGYADEEPEEKPTPPDVSFTASGLTVSKPRHTAAVKEAYDDPFSHYWDRAMPVGSSLESKAKTLAEYAKADKLTDEEYEDWLNDHKSDTKLTATEFKRFKKKSLRKFERLSHATGAVDNAGPVPSFIHPETKVPYHGMPGQSLMEHARLQTGLKTQDVWRLLADEHVHKA